MRPGLTCLWAVSGRDAVDFETWMKLDMEYIDNWSLALDWKILLRTVPQVLSGKGANPHDCRSEAYASFAKRGK